MRSGASQFARAAIRPRRFWIQRGTPEKRLTYTAVFVLLGLLAALIFHARFHSGVLGWTCGTFLYNPAYRYSDLTETLAQARRLDPYVAESTGWIAVYFPFTYWALTFVRSIPPKIDILLYLVSSVGGYLSACFLGGLAFGGATRRGLCLAVLMSVAVLTSYPFLIAIDRGNLDSITGILCFLSLLLLFLDRPVTAALLLATAISIKGYPLMLCSVFAARGRMKAACLAVLGAVLLNVMALNGLAGGMAHNWVGYCANMREFQSNYVQGDKSLHFFADPYNGLRVLSLCAMHRWASGASLFLYVLPIFYPLFSLALLWFAGVYTVLAQAPFHRHLLAATLGMILYPNVANDYKLLHLLPVVFFMALDEGPWSKRDVFAFVAMLVLLVPKNYYFLFSDVSISCVISPLLMLALLATIALDGAAWRSVYSRVREPRATWRGLFQAETPGGQRQKFLHVPAEMCRTSERHAGE